MAERTAADGSAQVTAEADGVTATTHAGAAPTGPTRRHLFLAIGGAAAAGAAGWMLRGVTAPDSSSASEAPDPDPAEPAAGPLGCADLRPGITFPAIPQRYALVEVLAVPGVSARELLHRVGAAMAALPAQPDDAGTVTVTFGFAVRHALQLWPQRAAAASEFPSFANDDDAIVTGGDLAVQVCSETAAGAHDTAAAVRDALGDATPVWRQLGMRDGPTPEGTARTAAGFIDGIINPRGAQELAAGVWADARTRDTHWVLRRMHISPDFARRPVREQERAIGRRRDTGAPLSGGSALDQVDLFAKQPDGELITPVDAHARRANPTHLGRPLMLRRSYSIELEDGPGLLFIAFLSDPETFVLTQRRLDQQDAFIAHTRTTASGCFFVPGEI